MADLKYTADFSQIAKEVRKNRKDLNDWSTAVSGDLQKVNREMSLAGKTSTLALTNMGKQMNRMGVLTQQAGYQIGDFIVQVQSGTNAFVAFGQQATQVAGTLTLLGGKWLAIGTALGIVIPLVTAVAAGIMRTRKEVEDFGKTTAKTIDDLKKKLDELRGEDKQAEAFQREIAALEARYKTEQEYLTALINSEEKLNQQSTVRSDTQRKKVAQIAEELQRQNAQYEEYKRLLAEIEAQEQRNKALENVKELREEIGAAASSMLEFAGVDITKPVSDAVKEAAVLAARLGTSLEMGMQLNRTEMGAGILKASAAARALAKELNVSLHAALRMQGMLKRGPSTNRERGDPRGEATSPDAAGGLAPGVNDPSLYTGYGNFYGTSPSGEGGGGGGSPQEDRIGALAQSLATETELLEQWYQDSLVQLSEFNAKELELLGGQNEAKLRLEQEYQDRLAAIEQTAQQRKLSETAGLFGALASIASTGGKKMAKIAATFGAIEATINAYKGATAALADPNISVAGRLAAYASVLAAGLQGVAAIRQAGGIGGGSGGGSGGGGAIATPATAAATPQRVLIEGIGPNDLITGTQLSEIFDKLYEENENRGLVFQIAS